LDKYISILFIGDVVGDAGLKAIKDWLPDFKQKYAAILL